MATYFPGKILALTLLLLLVAFHARAQEEQSTSNIASEDYEQVINLLFPLDELKNRREFVTILRYKPSFTAESQIVMIRREGYFQVIEYKSLDGNLFYKLNGMPSVRGMQPTEMAKNVRVGKRELRITYAQAQKWRKHLLSSIYAEVRPKTLKYTPPADTVSVMSDGTSYELWDNCGWEVHFEVQGGDMPKDNPRSPTDSFIRWMHIVQKQIAKRK